MKTWYIFVKNNIMKDINGNELKQPYYDLAVMRREQQMDTKFVKQWEELYQKEAKVKDSFDWGETPEGHSWWSKVSRGNHPPIPQSSLDELEAWRKSKIVEAEEAKIKKGCKVRIIGNTNSHWFRKGEVVLVVNKANNKLWECESLDNGDHWFVKESDMELIEEPANTTDWIDPLNVKRVSDIDWKAMYQVIIDKYNELDKRYLDLLEIQQKEAKQRVTAEPSNFIAECAMRAMQGLLSDPNYKDVQHTIAGNIVTKPQPKVIAERAFDYAEAMAAEGRKRKYLPNTENV